MTSRDINKHQEQESGRTTIRSNSSDACFQHFLFICLHRRIPLGVTSGDLNWLAREQGFASYPSGSASGLDLFYIQVARHQATLSRWRMATRPMISRHYQSSKLDIEPCQNCDHQVQFTSDNNKNVPVHLNWPPVPLTHVLLCTTISVRIISSRYTLMVPSKVSIRTKMVTPNNWFVSCSRSSHKTTSLEYQYLTLCLLHWFARVNEIWLNVMSRRCYCM